MLVDVSAVQNALRAEGLDGWLWFDFQGSNPIAQRLAGLAGGGHLTSRRWFYLIPAEGEPRALVHAIERKNLDGLAGGKTVYAGRAQLERGLGVLLSGVSRIAMEYSPRGAIPYVSRVDAGTFELIREHDIEIVSSGNLVQQFEARWTPEAMQSHRLAADALHRVKDRAFEEVASGLRHGKAITEFDLQQLMVGWFAEENLVSDSPPNVSAQENAADPHYLPGRDGSRSIRPDELLLLDLWGKLPSEGAVFADITWVGFTGRAVPAAMAGAFAAVRNARDAAVSVIEEAARAGRQIRGFEVDRTARGVIDAAGYGAHVLHRTGHSLGESVHGNGAHLDDYETCDERALLPGTGFTIEPGLYFDDFGVRTEINVVWEEQGPEVTGPRQRDIVSLV